MFNVYNVVVLALISISIPGTQLFGLLFDIRNLSKLFANGFVSLEKLSLTFLRAKIKPEKERMILGHILVVPTYVNTLKCTYLHMYVHDH